MFLIILCIHIALVNCNRVDLNTTNILNVLKSYNGVGSLDLYVKTEIQLNDLIKVNVRSGVLSFIGENNSYINCENTAAGFRFQGIGKGKLTFHNVTFSNCGPNVSAVIILDNVNAEFTGCHFISNFASGINARDSNVMISNSVFFGNNAQNVTPKFESLFIFGVTNLGGAIGIMFAKTNSKNVLISNCKVLCNSAFVSYAQYVNTHATNIKRNLSNYFALGGGIAIINTLSTKYNQVNITDSIINKNIATYAGGVLVTFVDDASENYIYLNNVTLNENYVPQTGGGFVFSSWDCTHRNQLIMRNSIINGNEAMTGGGGKMIFNNENPTSTNEAGIFVLKIINTMFHENLAKSASAIRLLFNQPNGMATPVMPTIEDCNITYNKPSNHSKEYLGAIISSRLSLILAGYNRFTHNKAGSVIYISNAEIHVKGHTLFLNNQGKYGGAMYIADVSKLYLYPNSLLCFEGNKADVQGGALYIEASNYLETMYQYNPSCFLQYSIRKTPPSEWTAKIKFISNSASVKGAAIFISSLLQCQWAEKEGESYQSFKKALRWNKNVFEYRNNSLVYETFFQSKHIYGEAIDIATDTYTFLISPEQELQVSPGEQFHLNITSLDQIGSPVYSVPSIRNFVNFNATSESSFFLQHVVLTPGRNMTALSVNLPNMGMFNNLISNRSKHHIRVVDAMSNFEARKDLTVRIVKCHHGFKFNGKTCVCNSKLEGVERCENGRYLYLKRGYWAGEVNNKFVTHICPREYCFCISKNNNSNECFYDYKNKDEICVPGRGGVLCGKCNDGLSVGLQMSQCRDCTGTWFLLCSLIIVVVFTLLIIYFNPGIPSDLRGILFYVQVLPYVFAPNDNIGDVINFVTGIIDFGRPSDYPLNTCAVDALGNLGMTTLNYVTPLIIVIILSIFFVFRKKINLKRGRPFQAFFVLLIMMYKYLTETSLLILHCVDVGGRFKYFKFKTFVGRTFRGLKKLQNICNFCEINFCSWRKVMAFTGIYFCKIMGSQGDNVFYYDGSWKCYTGFHLGFAVVAGIVLVLFVVGPVLIIFSLTVCVCFNVNNAIMDIITHGLQRPCPHVPTSRHNSEKESENCVRCRWLLELWRANFGTDKGWWWTIDLMRRVAVVAIYVYFQDRIAKQTALTIAFLCILTLHCLNQPYDNTNEYANIIETWYLFSLTALSTIQTMVDHEHTRNTITLILIAFSYCFALIYFLYKAVLFIKKRRQKKNMNKSEAETMEKEDKAGSHGRSSSSDVVDSSKNDRAQTFSAIGIISDRLERDNPSFVSL